LTTTPLFSVEYIAFRTDEEPLDDPHIRTAMRLAFPQERVAVATFNGRVEAAGGLVPNGMLGREFWPVESAHDTDEARRQIELSRYGSAELVPPIRLYTAVPDRAESFRDVMMAELGLRIEVLVVDWVSYLTGLANREFPAYLLYWGADYPDPETFLLTLFGTGAPDNYVGFSNGTFDELLVRASVTQDPAERIGLYDGANQLLIDEAVIVPLYYDVAYTLVRSGVEDLRITPLGLLYLDSVRVLGN
jgi:ABC-type oligopeptide transport system substrate-binding subunit